MSPRLLLVLLIVAGFSCCVAMSMPQVHIVAYCGDLGYGVARGAQMLSLMLFLGIVSRIGSGFVADAIGGSATLLVGSFMQGMALLLYMYFDGLTSLFVVSGIFGLFQGGIVPMYAVICRELLPPREAGAKIGLVVSATIFGMAFGGYFSGVIFDLTVPIAGVPQRRPWNAFNFAVVGWLFWRGGSCRPRPGSRPSPDAGDPLASPSSGCAKARRRSGGAVTTALYEVVVTIGNEIQLLAAPDGSKLWPSRCRSAVAPRAQGRIAIGSPMVMLTS